MKAQILSVLFAAMSATALAGSSANAQGVDAASFSATTLNLSANGEVQVAPDEAWLQTGVSTEAPTAAAAVNQDRMRMTAVVAAMTALGVSGPDVQTSALQLSARHLDDPKGGRRSDGYQARNTVTVRVRDLSSVGAVVDALVATGADEIEGVDFDRTDRGPAEDEARGLAVKALQAKAALYAEATGYRVKRLVSLSEGGGPVFEPMARRAEVMVSGARLHPTPVAPGELTVRVAVSGEYELSR